MSLELGLYCVFPEPLVDTPGGIDAMVNIAMSSRWPWRFVLVDVLDLPARPTTAIPKGRVPKDQLASVARHALSSPTAHMVGFAVSRRAPSDTARLNVECRDLANGGTNPHTIRAMCRAPEEDSEHRMTEWVELAHEIVVAVGAAHGVVVATTRDEIMRCELWAMNMSIEGREVHPDPARISGIAVERPRIGDEWVRPPHWGTYLSRRHMDPVGGRDKIIDVVRPAVVRDVGDLTYFQLTANVRDSVGPEAEQRRRAFADLLEPVTVPRIR